MRSTKAVRCRPFGQAAGHARKGGRQAAPRPTLAERLAESLGPGFGSAPHEGLSNREFEVLRRIGAGRTGQIAVELHLSVETVSTYRARILEKMNMKTTAEIMRYAVEQGLSA